MSKRPARPRLLRSFARPGRALAAVALAHALDWATTALVLGAGVGHELNPIGRAAWGMGGAAGLLALKAIGLSITLAMALRIEANGGHELPGARRLVRALVYFAILAPLAAVGLLVGSGWLLPLAALFASGGR